MTVGVGVGLPLTGECVWITDAIGDGAPVGEVVGSVGAVGVGVAVSRSGT